MPVTIRDGVLCYDDKPVTPREAVAGAVSDWESACFQVERAVEQGHPIPRYGRSSLSVALRSMKAALDAYDAQQRVGLPESCSHVASEGAVTYPCVRDAGHDGDHLPVFGGVIRGWVA